MTSVEDQHDRGRRDGEFLLSTLTEIEKELPFHLVGVGVDFYQYPIERSFGYPVYQWLQTIQGCGTLRWAAGEASVPEGHGMLLYPDEPHQYYAASESGSPWYVHWITFSGYDIERILHQIGLVGTGVYAVSDPPILEADIRKALQILRTDQPLKGLDASALIYTFLLNLYKYVRPGGRPSQVDHNRRLKPAFDFIEAHISGPITVERVSESIGVTPQHFCVLFKDLTGLRPTEYINSRRIDRAKDMLIRHAAMKVHEVARMVGFENESYFSTVFKKYEGVSPRKYRNLHLQ